MFLLMVCGVGGNLLRPLPFPCAISCDHHLLQQLSNGWPSLTGWQGVYPGWFALFSVHSALP